jgi:anti-sigma-K factor RskA
MNCKTNKSQLVEYADGALGADARQKMERHLSQCASCARLVREQEDARHLLAGLPTRQTSQQFDAILAERLAAARRPAAQRPAGSLWRPRFSVPSVVFIRSAWAAGAAGIALAGIFFTHPAGPPQRPSPDDASLISQCVALHQRDVAAQPLANAAPRGLSVSESGWTGETTSDSAAQENL